MQFLKVAKAQDAHLHSVKYLLHKQVTASHPARSLAMLHASDVTKTGFCARRMALMLTTGIKPGPEKITTSLALTFHLGRTVQDAIVGWAADAGFAIGHWRCAACNRLSTFCYRPRKCDCGRSKFDPVEVRLTSTYSGVSGSFDMLANVGLPKLRLVEIKTMGPDDFKKLSAPLAEHKHRTALYLRIAAESSNPLSDRIDYDQATVLYASKGGFGVSDPELAGWGLSDKFSPFKEFTVSRDDALTQKVSDMGRALTEWRHGRGGMPDPICMGDLDTHAKYCPVRDQCFSGHYPAGAVNPLPLEAAA